MLKNQNAGLPLLLQKLLAPGEYVEKTEPKNFSQEDEELGIHRVFSVLSFLGLIWEDFLDVFSPRMLKNNFKASFMHYGHFWMSKGHVQVSPREGEITKNCEVANLVLDSDSICFSTLHDFSRKNLPL